MTSPHNDPIAPHLATIKRLRAKELDFEDLTPGLRLHIQHLEMCLEELLALKFLVEKSCGVHNCNCPSAPAIRQALKDFKYA